MVLGFDLDNVFINKPPVIPHWVIERLYRKKTNGVLQYRIPSRKEQIIRVASHFSVLRPAIQKNLTFLRNLPKENHQLYLISSRFGFLENTTNRLIKKHNLEQIFDDMHFNFDNNQPHIFKTEIIKKLKIDRYIDDDLHVLKYVAGRNNKVKLYWFNKKVNKKISPNIIAITKISDMLDK